MPKITDTKDLLDMRHYWINVLSIGWEIAWWDTDGQRWYHCGSDVPLYHKDGDVLEINGPVDLDDQDEITRLNELVAKLTAERDEADRRAGAAERELASMKESAYKTRVWRDEIKEEFGIPRNDTFDRVIELARGYRDSLLKIAKHGRNSDSAMARTLGEIADRAINNTKP